jgi:hypothetical protein
LQRKTLKEAKWGTSKKYFSSYAPYSIPSNDSTASHELDTYAVTFLPYLNIAFKV